MKFFHLSDLHIGLRLLGRDLYDDQKHILDAIVAAARQEQPDAVVCAGDIFDKAVPSAEAVGLFDRFVDGLVQAIPEGKILMISGNHDSAQRLNMFRSVLSHRNIHMIGLPPQSTSEHMEKVTVEDAWGPVHFYLLPFVKPSMGKTVLGTGEDGCNLSYQDTVAGLLQREALEESARNVLVSHQFYIPVGGNAEEAERMDSEIVTVGNVDAVTADVLHAFDYCALGHIHKPMTVGAPNVRYCGTPLACSVSEAGQEKGIVVVEMAEKGSVTTRILPLIPLHPVRVIRGELAQVLQQGSEDYVSLVLTDENDLDVLDMQDRLRAAFPNLLEIRRLGVQEADYSGEVTGQTVADPFAMCCAFLKDPDEDTAALLQDVIRAVQGVM